MCVCLYVYIYIYIYIYIYVYIYIYIISVYKSVTSWTITIIDLAHAAADEVVHVPPVVKQHTII